MTMRFILIILNITTTILLFSCNKPIEEPEKEKTAFAKGVDISWVTEMERDGIKFYNKEGEERECTALMKELSFNSIRLRVWVNPKDGWCGKEDLLVKAKRAYQLGMRLMIDFHYSDSWADPGKQNKPKDWENYSLAELSNAVKNHTKEILQLLKNEGITPEWVQVGNETSNGMLWEDGKASLQMANYALLNNAGYDAVKEVFPETKVIVHLPNGYDKELYKWLFNALRANGGKWDIIGMSLYPSKENWETRIQESILNIKQLVINYKTDVMICEVGMPWDDPGTCKSFLSELITKCKAIDNDRCKGIFYWEPQSNPKWNGYTLGAFDSNFKPTSALEAFKL